MKQGFKGLFATISLVVLLLAGLCATAAFAQTETGSITGMVTDPSGAAVGSARVQVKSVNTGLTRGTETSSTGAYNVPGLKPDLYNVTVEAAGFQKMVRQVNLAVSATAEVSVQLSVGATSQTVEVTGVIDTVAVNVESQTISETVTSKQIELLPTSPTRWWEFRAMFQRT